MNLFVLLLCVAGGMVALTIVAFVVFVLLVGADNARLNLAGGFAFYVLAFVATATAAVIIAIPVLGVLYMLNKLYAQALMSSLEGLRHMNSYGM